MNRFFVRVFAANPLALRRLQKFDFDLFQPTARRTEDKRASIDGLLTMEQIEKLVLDGYQVLIEEEASKRAHGQKEIMTVEEWRAERKV
jgi:hypothetical protein